MRGVRFAPSPTGRFHVGNLRTAWIAARLAQLLDEPLVIRIEDIDSARSRNDFMDLQLADLKRLGIEADEQVIQSSRYSRHLELFNRAVTDGLVYPCDCSRKDVLDALAGVRSAPHGKEAEYSGRCRTRQRDEMRPAETLAWRWRSEPGTSDRPDGRSDGHLDVIVARTNADGGQLVPGYHWACAIDDADGDYHLLVRAWDLAAAESTQQQIRRWVRLDNASSTFHTALVCRDDGGRLEKRTKGVTLDELIADGYTAERLLKIFEASFSIDSTNIRAQIETKGEALRRLSLSELLR